MRPFPPLFLSLFLASCAREAPGPSRAAQETIAVAEAVATPEELAYNPELKVEIAAMRKLPSGVLIQDLIPGEGDSLASGMNVAVRYTGWLPDGTEIDTNRETEPYRFKLGAGMVIPGWDVGLVGMRRGGLRKLVIPPAEGYGDLGSGPVPPNAILVFDVELVEIIK